MGDLHLQSPVVIYTWSSVRDWLSKTIAVSLILKQHGVSIRLRSLLVLVSNKKSALEKLGFNFLSSSVSKF